VTRLTEPNTKFQQFAYNDNGEPTDQIDQLGNHTLLTYETWGPTPTTSPPTGTPWGGANGTGRTIPT
jgi:uncharacterized protein RhaS with RHS repeats